MREGRTDMLAAHAETVGAKDDHIEDLHKRLEAIKNQNKRLLRWHRFFLVENIFLATLTIADILVPTFGYFRGHVSDFFSNHLIGTFRG